MSQRPQAWRVGQNCQVARLPEVAPELEKHLEDWIFQDPTTVADDILLIGRQVLTGFGTYIDLLAIDPEGNLVVIELKRDKTLRETVAQAIEYAAWCAQLGYDEVIHQAAKACGGEEAFRGAFTKKFGEDLPDTLNQSQRMLIVAPEITDATHTVIDYLSDTFGVPINVVSFGLFEVAGEMVLVRQAALPESPGAGTRPPTAKSRPAPPIEELLRRAEENGVGPLAQRLWAMHPLFPTPWRYLKSWAFALPDRQQKNRSISAVVIHPTVDTKPGAVVLGMNLANLQAVSGRDREVCKQFVNRMKTEVGKAETSGQGDWQRVSFNTVAQVDQFVKEFLDFVGIAPVSSEGTATR